MTGRLKIDRKGLIRRRGAQRGSTILLVITILSLLALLAVTMTFTSRLEISAAYNFSTGVQNRIAAITSVDAIATELSSSLPAGPLSPLDLTLNEQFADYRPGSGNSRQVSAMFALSPNTDIRFTQTQFSDETDRQKPVFQPLQKTGTGDVVVIDASSRININAADEDLLAGFFDAVAKKSGVPANGARIARAIAQIRLGVDGAPGRKDVDDDFDTEKAVKLKSDEGSTLLAQVQSAEKALAQVRDNGSHSPQDLHQRRDARSRLVHNIDEPDEYIADVRVPAFGDDVRFASISDLPRYPAIESAGLGEELLEAATPYLTIFSVSLDERIVEGEARPLIDLNRATAGEILEGLRELYGSEKNSTLLSQFAVNIADARDTDDVPTVLSVSDSNESVIGVERMPFITEIYPDALSPVEQGDDGQFLEIHNPWEEEIDVTGWRVQGPGGVFPLRGKILPKGYMLLTDDADNSLDDEEANGGTGSLYDIFGVLPDSNLRRAITMPHLELPDSQGTEVGYELLDHQGNLIDRFRYTPDSRDKDSLYSYQRENPAVRVAIRSHATPFGMMPRRNTAKSEALARLANYPQNGPFVDVVDLFQVFSGFVDEEDRVYSPWGFPVAATPASADAADVELARDERVIDARVLDAFTVSYRPADKNRENRNSLRNEDDDGELITASVDLPAEFLSISRASDPEEIQAFVANNYFAPRAGLRHGRVNLNTAGEMALASLPGIDEATATRVVERRRELISRAQEGLLEDGILYHTLSDVLVDDLLWSPSHSGEDRLQQFRLLLPHIALNSKAFFVVGQPRMDSGADVDLMRANRIEALVSIDRGTAETIYKQRAYD